MDLVGGYWHILSKNCYGVLIRSNYEFRANKWGYYMVKERETERRGGGVLVGWIYFLEQGENPFYALYFLELNYVIFCCNH